MNDRTEILAASSLEDCDWPENDPHSVHQETIAFSPRYLDLVRLCIESARVDVDSFLKDARKKNVTSKEEILLRLLTHQKFQMNTPSSVRNEGVWLERINASIRDDSAIEIVYPQFCSIPNAPKQYTNIGPAAGEDCSIEFFRMINDCVKAIHPPGVHFHILADATLYASAFQTHQTEAVTYQQEVERRIEALNATDIISLYDYAELLRTKCHPDYQRAYYEIGHKVWSGKLEELLPSTNIESLRRSVRCCVNTRRFQLSHDDHKRLFGPARWRENDHPFFERIENLTDLALLELVTIRLACAEIDLATRVWPRAIRATCHKGQKNGRWAIGLKPIPDYYGECKLLPYHGMPLFKRDRKGNPKLTIDFEVVLRSNKDLARIKLPRPGLFMREAQEDSEIYAYIEPELNEWFRSG